MIKTELLFGLLRAFGIINAVAMDLLFERTFAV